MTMPHLMNCPHTGEDWCRMSAIVYEVVDWAIIQTHEGEPYASFRNCDVCFESALQDIWAGLPESQWRMFTRQHGGNADGCNVCSNCIDLFLMEEPI